MRLLRQAVSDRPRPRPRRPLTLARWLLKAATALVSLPFIYFALAAFGAVIPGSHPQIDGGPMTRVALARGPIHYDLLLPISDDLRATFAFAEGQGVPVRDPRVRYLIIGWGSKAFYTATGTYRDLNLSSVWPALTGDQATLHLDVTGEVEGIDGISWIDLSRDTTGSADNLHNRNIYPRFHWKSDPSAGKTLRPDRRLLCRRRRIQRLEHLQCLDRADAARSRSRFRGVDPHAPVGCLFGPMVQPREILNRGPKVTSSSPMSRYALCAPRFFQWVPIINTSAPSASAA